MPLATTAWAIAVWAAETAATAAAFTTTTTAAAEAASAWRTWLQRTCFVDYDIAAAQRLTVYAVDSSLCFCIRAHFHKAEAFRAACVTFHHDFSAGHQTKLTEMLLKIAITNRIWQIANV